MIIDKNASVNADIAPPAYESEPGTPGAHWEAPNQSVSRQPQQSSPQPGQPQLPQVSHPPSQQPQWTAVQVGEQYRAAQFAKCAQGIHQRRTRFGICGIIAAVVLFPVGLVCLFLDTKEVCTVCGERVG